MCVHPSSRSTRGEPHPLLFQRIASVDDRSQAIFQAIRKDCHQPSRRSPAANPVDRAMVGPSMPRPWSTKNGGPDFGDRLANQ